MSTNFCTECNKYLELIIKYFRKLSIKFIGTYTHYNVCSPLWISWFFNTPQQKLIKRLEAIEGQIIAVISTSDYEYKKNEIKITTSTSDKRRNEIWGFKYNQLKISQTIKKPTNINKLYNYWTDFERINLSKIYEILSCRKNIFISNRYAFF